MLNLPNIIVKPPTTTKIPTLTQPKVEFCSSDRHGLEMKLLFSSPALLVNSRPVTRARFKNAAALGGLANIINQTFKLCMHDDKQWNPRQNQSCREKSLNGRGEMSELVDFQGILSYFNVNKTYSSTKTDTFTNANCRAVSSALPPEPEAQNRMTWISRHSSKRTFKQKQARKKEKVRRGCRTTHSPFCVIMGQKRKDGGKNRYWTHTHTAVLNKCH